MIPLDLADIQGNIHRAYGRFGFPHARHVFLNIANPAAGRRFVDAIRPAVTTAEPWTGGKPRLAVNIGFTFLGLHALDLPTRTLRLLPDEFIDGMGCRADILGDIGDSAPDRWDPVWRPPHNRAHQVHVWVSLNGAANPDGSPAPEMAQATTWLMGLAEGAEGITVLGGHGADGASRWQDAAAIMHRAADGTAIPLPREHFGFTDGISDPVFRGQYDAADEAAYAVGGGKIAEGPFDPASSWSALEAGEFILGQVDEGQELPVATQPQSFVRNGTFMVWRKLRQDVGAFEGEMERQARLFERVMGPIEGAADSPGEDAAFETLCAKVVGRWRSGIPLMRAPDWAAHLRLRAEWADCLNPALRSHPDPARARAFDAMMTGFRYGDDLDGSRCPFGAHLRRANPRDMLDPALDARLGASTLTNRRRLLRRGLPFVDPDGEKGVVFMGVCASLFRQFEFIQQQWMSYGLDFEAGNDTCPLVGVRVPGADKHVIPGPRTAFIAANLPGFVSTRGGDYFMLPSLSALRMIGMGTIDPT